MAAAATSRRFDPKRLNRALFGLAYEEDIYDRFCTRLPRLMRLFRWRLEKPIRARGVIFVHVPRVAGTSIARALYGPQTTHHYSARYYRGIDPGFFAAAESFAVLRDPFDRFASSYAFVRDGGTPSCRMSAIFRDETRHIAGVDAYLDYLEARAPAEMDFAMRPQSWFVCDQAGAPLVKRLFLYGEDEAALATYLEAHGGAPLPWLNRARRTELHLTAEQRARIAAIYAGDFTLIAQVRAARARKSGVLRTAAE